MSWERSDEDLPPAPMPFFVRDVTDTAPKDLGQKLAYPDSDLAVITVGTKPKNNILPWKRGFCYRSSSRRGKWKVAW